MRALSRLVVPLRALFYKERREEDLDDTPLLSGRTFTSHDNEASPDIVIIVHEALASRYWPPHTP